MSVPTTISARPGWTFTTPPRPLVWLITGCSSGLGLALARQVQAAGHTVIATSRNPERTPDLVAEITSHPTAAGRWLQLDVDDPRATKVISDLQEEQGVTIDVLVNNAGWSIHQTVENFGDDEVRAQFETIFFGPYRLMRAVLPAMRKRRFGIIVNMSSGASLEGRESMGAYAAAKAAMDGLTKVLAKEVAEFNIRTLTVLLGGFNTSMPAKIAIGKEPLPEDYNDKVVGKVIAFMHGGHFVADGDPAKAAKAVCEVVLGQGVGAGKEAEMLMPLGREMKARVELVRDRMDYCWEAFGDVAMNVFVDE